MLDVKLPAVGENIESGTVINISVAVGDTVTKDQDLVELETDKATLPVPSPYAGTVKEILVQSGDEVKIGQVLLRLESVDTADQSTEATPPVPEDIQKAVPASPAPSTQSESHSAPTPTGNYDAQLVVIGGGPGGYAAAFLAADLGLQVTLIDKDVNPGGVCLYRGCIPSKALLHAAKVLSEAREAKEFGIEFAQPTIDLDKLRGWKDSVVSRLTGGLGQLTKQRKITYIQGTAVFTDSHSLSITKADGSTDTLTFEQAILATGSSPVRLPHIPESPRVLDSTTALDIENVPKSLLLVGAGYIGLELGTVYAELGSDVSVIEMLPGIVPGADRDLTGVLERRLKTIFKDILCECKVTAMEDTGSGMKVSYEDKEGTAHTKEFEKVLVAIGRRPNSKGLGLEHTKVQVDDQGFVKVNPQRRTDDPAIYAIGDLTGNPMLAHKASHEGRVAVESIAGHKVAFEPSAIPAVMFTDPEIAWCGLTENEAAEQGRKVKVARFPWAASGRAITLARPDGITKLIIDPDTERILGVAIAGAGAGEMIAEGVVAIEMSANATDLKLCIHPHPTLSETIMESAEGFFGQSTHIYRKK